MPGHPLIWAFPISKLTQNLTHHFLGYDLSNRIPGPRGFCAPLLAAWCLVAASPEDPGLRGYAFTLHVHTREKNWGRKADSRIEPLLGDQRRCVEPVPGHRFAGSSSAPTAFGADQMTIIGPYEVISGYRGVALGPPGAEVRFGIPRAETTDWHKLQTIYPIKRSLHLTR